MLTFNAVDVETANADRASICQIGIVHVRDGEIEDQWQTLVNPEEWFDPYNVSIHGIDEDAVRYSPTFSELRGKLRSLLRGSVLVSHTSFDRVAFERSMTRYNLEQLQVTWLDSARIARRAWPREYGQSGYGLKNIAKDLDISFKHHDALEDARATAEVVLSACATTRSLPIRPSLANGRRSTVFSGFDEAVVVDVETTGLDPTSDRIISVAMVRARFSDLRQDPNGLHGDTIDAIVNPQCRIPRQASRIHGIRDKDVKHKGPFSEIAQQLRNFIGDRPIVAHNASFDKNFLNAEFKRAGVKTLSRNKSFCTMRRFQDFNHGFRRGSNLENVAIVMGMKGRKSSKHEATQDVRMVWEVAGSTPPCPAGDLRTTYNGPEIDANAGLDH